MVDRNKDNNDPEFLDDVGEMIRHFTKLQGLPEADARALADAVTKRITENYNGQRINIKKPRKWQDDAEKIRAQFDGTNAKKISKAYGVSRATIYRIINCKC